MGASLSPVLASFLLILFATTPPASSFVVLRSLTRPFLLQVIGHGALSKFYVAALRRSPQSSTGSRVFSTKGQEQADRPGARRLSDRAKSLSVMPECQHLSAFLPMSRAAVQEVISQGSGSKEKLLLVMGNEASDVDSIVCALTLALGASSGALDDVLRNLSSEYRCAPVVNIPSEDLALRQDAMLMLRRQDISPASLIFFPTLDESTLRTLIVQQRLAVLLVDHNALTERQSWLADAVIGVVDHHEDSGTFTRARLRIVEPAVGSCAALVGKLLGESEAGRALLQVSTVRSLLSAPLLLDTGLFATKFSDTDRALAEKLDLMEGPAASGTAAELYRALLDGRTQVDGLSSRQRLRKDYKRWRHGGVDYGIATVPCALQEWLDDPEAGDISGALAATARDEGLSLLLVMTTFMDASGSGLRRQLIVWAPDSSLAGECASFLVSATFLDWEAQLGIAPSLSLESLKLSDTSLLAFSQSNGKASRKQMQPAVAAFLESR